jgi:tyrosine-protein kinase Etk/Wzc
MPDTPPGSPGSSPSSLPVPHVPHAAAEVVPHAPGRAPAFPSAPAAPPPPVGEEPGDEGLTVMSALQILRRRWLVALPVFLAALAATAVRYTQVVPQYEASTSIRLDKKSPVVAGISQTGIQERNPLSTEILVIKSRGVAQKVVARTGYAVRVVGKRVARTALFDSVRVPPSALRGTYEVSAAPDGAVTVTAPDGRRTIGRVATWVEAGGLRLFPTPRLLREREVQLAVLSDAQATAQLQGLLGVTQIVRDAQLLRLAIRDPDPRLAASVTDAVAEVFIGNSSERRQSGGSATVAFIRSQLDTLDRQLLEAETALRDWRAQQQVVEPAAAAGAAVNRRADYEARLADRRMQVDNVESILRASGRGGADTAYAWARYRRVLALPTLAQGNAGGGSVLTTIRDLETQRAQLLARRTGDDPDVRLLDQTIADFEQRGRQQVESYLEGLRSEINGYERILATVGRTLETLPGQELTLATLTRNTQLLSELQTTLRTRLKEAEITNAADVATVEIVDRAEVPGAPVAPVLQRYLMVGLAAGALLALLAALGIDRMDRTIHSREDIENATRVPLVGLIPAFQPGRAGLLGRGAPGAAALKSTARPAAGTALATANGKTVLPMGDTTEVVAVTAPRHVSAEAYRMLRTNLRFAPADRPNKVLAVSSPSPGDGKSTTVVNFAATVAVQGKRVLIVDGDMRKGTLHQKLGISRNPGLSAVLSGALPIDGAVRTVQLTDGVLLDVITAGDAPPNPTELLGGSALNALVAWARAHYDQVVMDTPPVNMFADGLLVAAASDSMLLVGRAGKSHREELQVAAEQLRALEVRMAGVVLNDFDARRDGRFGGYYYYERYQYKYYAAYADDQQPEKG